MPDVFGQLVGLKLLRFLNMLAVPISRHLLVIHLYDYNINALHY